MLCRNGVALMYTSAPTIRMHQGNIGRLRAELKHLKYEGTFAEQAVREGQVCARRCVRAC